jgi:hypothetical protein
MEITFFYELIYELAPRFGGFEEFLFTCQSVVPAELLPSQSVFHVYPSHGHRQGRYYRPF